MGLYMATLETILQLSRFSIGLFNISIIHACYKKNLSQLIDLTDFALPDPIATYFLIHHERKNPQRDEIWFTF